MPRSTIQITVFFIFIFLLFWGAPSFAVLSESWESGSIDSSKWTIFGTPSPKIVTTGHNSSYALDCNSDTWWHSGVYSKETFKLANGFMMEFWLKGVTTANTHYMRIQGKISDNIVKPEGHTNLIVGVTLVCPNMPTAGYMYFVGGDYFEEPYLDDNWHKVSIQVNPNGTVAFYRDGVLKFTSTSKIDFIP